VSDNERDPVRLVARLRGDGADVNEVRAGALLRELPSLAEPSDAAVARVEARVATRISARQVPHRFAWAVAAIVLAASSAGAALGFRALRVSREIPAPVTRPPGVRAPAPSGDVAPREPPVLEPPADGSSLPPPRSPRTNSPPRAPVRPEDPALAEARVLSAALRKLRTDKDPAGALALLDKPKAAPRVLVDETALARVEALLLLGRKAEALRVLESHAVGIPSQRRQIAVVRGELAAEIDQCGDAVVRFTQVLNVGAGADELTERALFGRATCRARLGLGSAADADLREYLRRFPHGRFAGAARAAVGAN
jgi:hypothetical protein